MTFEAGCPVDLPSILKYELLPVLLSLAEINGFLCSGNKYVLADMVTEDRVCPGVIELYNISSCLLIDEQALVLTLVMPGYALIFVDMADIYVGAVLNSGYNYLWVDIVFDRYIEETIKGTTRIRHIKVARQIRRLVEGWDVLLPKN